MAERGSKSQRDLDEAVAAARAAQERADMLTRDASARIVDADLRAMDADAQSRHARTAIAAADAHMEAARLHMEAANSHEADASVMQERADEQLAEAAARLADANDDGAEYQRAIYHYTQLVRHRMANPIQTICGMSQTLMDTPDIDAGLRHRLVTAINEQAQILARVCLEPRVLHESERELHPRPFE